MRRGLSSLKPLALACGSVLLLASVTVSAAAQIYSCPPGYYLASDYRCYAQGYAVAPPVPPYVYDPRYAYAYPQPYYDPYYYPGFELRFGFGGRGHFDGDRGRHRH
jgi:hypothetical protein